MKAREAIEATHAIYVGIEGKAVTRRDKRGRLWYLVTARGRYFLVKGDKSALKEVDCAFADKWDDWEPQTDSHARRESAFMNSRNGLRMRNVILGLVMGSVPPGLRAPDALPEDL